MKGSPETYLMKGIPLFFQFMIKNKCTRHVSGIPFMRYVSGIPFIRYAQNRKIGSKII
jgi:hypothetical protein